MVTMMTLSSLWSTSGILVRTQAASLPNGKQEPGYRFFSRCLSLCLSLSLSIVQSIETLEQDIW